VAGGQTLDLTCAGSAGSGGDSSAEVQVPGGGGPSRCCGCCRLGRCPDRPHSVMQHAAGCPVRGLVRADGVGAAPRGSSVTARVSQGNSAARGPRPRAEAALRRPTPPGCSWLAGSGLAWQVGAGWRPGLFSQVSTGPRCTGARVWGSRAAASGVGARGLRRGDSNGLVRRGGLADAAVVVAFGAHPGGLNTPSTGVQLASRWASAVTGKVTRGPLRGGRGRAEPARHRTWGLGRRWRGPGSALLKPGAGSAGGQARGRPPNPVLSHGTGATCPWPGRGGVAWGTGPGCCSRCSRRPPGHYILLSRG